MNIIGEDCLMLPERCLHDSLVLKEVGNAKYIV